MAKIVTLGEIMLRLSPQGNDRFIQTESFRIIPGGGEANVAISLANYGHDAYYVTFVAMVSIPSMWFVAVIVSVCTMQRQVLRCVLQR